MADNPKNRGPQERAKVNMDQDHEVEYWTKKWGVSENQLRAVVKATGPSTDAVAKYLGKSERT